MIHPQLPAVTSAKSAKEPAEPEIASKIVQVQPKSSHLKMGVHGVEQPAFNLGKDSFLSTGNQQQSKYFFSHQIRLGSIYHLESLLLWLLFGTSGVKDVY